MTLGNKLVFFSTLRRIGLLLVTGARREGLVSSSGDMHFASLSEFVGFRTLILDFSAVPGRGSGCGSGWALAGLRLGSGCGSGCS
jgi:hypothetical protein